ncbi:hypothetical protein CHUAL_005153 [Chamberlinius hualienensis]
MEQVLNETSSSPEDSDEDVDVMNNQQKKNATYVAITPLEKKLQRKIERLTKENAELKHMLFTRIPRLVTAVERSNYLNTQNQNHGQNPVVSQHHINDPLPNHNGEIVNNGHLAASFHEWDDFCSRYVRQSAPQLPSTSLPNDDQVEIFPGSGVLVPRMAFYNAQQCTNSASYVRALVQAVFPKSVLVRSNLRGGKSKTPVGMPQPSTKREKLDPVRLEAIYNAVYERFPGVKRGKLGICVNNYICGLRYRTRKKFTT